MNREELKKAFDAMTPSSEQKGKIFEGINAVKTTVRKKVFLKYATLMTAVVALAAGVFVLKTQISENKYLPLTIIETKQKIQRDRKAFEEENMRIPESNNASSEKNRQDEITFPDMVNGSPSKESGVVESETVFSENESAKTENPIANEQKAETEVLSDMNDTFQSQEEKSSFLDTDTSETNKKVVTSASGGGSGGGSSGSARAIDFEYVKGHPVYGSFFPRSCVEGFWFSNAFERNGLCALFLNGEGKQISISVTNANQGNTISVDEIQADEKGITSFTLECDGFFVTYRAETDNVEEIKKMVLSAPCYN